MTLARAIIIINLILLTLAAYLGVGIFYQFAGSWLAPPEDATFQITATAPNTSTTRQPISHYRPILERDLFDANKPPEPATKEEKVNVEELEATELKLKLWGTVAGIDERAYAVIEDLKKREQNLYRTGDSIQNATVKKIMRARVVLNHNGKDEVLAMEELSQGTGQSSRTSRDSARSSRTAFSEESSGTQPTQPVRRTQRVSLRREMINESMQDLSKLMTEIAIRPHMEDGQAAGLALTNIKPNSIFRRMGLRNGDILKGIDGNDISSVDDALQLYERLKDSDSLEVQLSRRGQERIINYNIR
jgi:general secretion pathway protein C